MTERSANGKRKQSEAQALAGARNLAAQRSRATQEAMARHDAEKARRHAAEEAAKPCEHRFGNWSYLFDLTPPEETRTCRTCGATEQRELRF